MGKRMVEIDGVRMSVYQASERFGVNYNVIRHNYDQGKRKNDVLVGRELFKAIDSNGNEVNLTSIGNDIGVSYEAMCKRWINGDRDDDLIRKKGLKSSRAAVLVDREAEEERREVQAMNKFIMKVGVK